MPNDATALGIRDIDDLLRGRYYTGYECGKQDGRDEGYNEGMAVGERRSYIRTEEIVKTAVRQLTVQQNHLRNHPPGRSTTTKERERMDTAVQNLEHIKDLLNALTT